MKKIFKYKHTFLLGLIFIFGVLLRFCQLNNNPPSLNWDEASLGYDAYSILKTGKDQYGEKLPLAFRSFDDYKPPVYVYLDVPFVKIFGLNSFAVRFPSAFLGSLSILTIYFIAKKIFEGQKNQRLIALLSSFLLAISPWHLLVSRPAYEANVGLSFFLIGVLFLLYSSEKIKYLYPSIAAFLLCVYSYHSFRLIVPCLLFLFFVSNFSEYKKKKDTYFSLFLFFILCLPLVKIFFSFQGLSRLDSAGLQTLGPQSSFLPYLVKGNSFIQILQKGYFLIIEILGRYLGYFSPANIFFRGDIQPAHNIDNFGPMFFWLFPFWGLGFYRVSKLAKNIGVKMLLYWIAVSPVASIFTNDWFALVRTLPIFPAYIIICSLGISSVFSWLLEKYTKKGLVIIFIFGCFVVYQIIFLIETIFIYLPKTKFGDWQYGLNKVVPYVSKIKNNYQKVIVESPQGQPFIFLLFYEPYPPEIYQKQVPLMPNPKDRRKYYDFGPYQFRKIYWPTDRGLTNTLFVGSEYSLPKNDVLNTKNAKILYDFLDPLRNISFRVVEIK